MAKGNRIILTPDRGTFVEGIINAAETPKPGTIYQIDPTQAQQGGRNVWKVYTRDADGDHPKGPHIVLTEDLLQGRDMTTAYAAGDRAFGFVPWAGCELNLLHYNQAGTADDVVAGDLLMVENNVGKVETSSGSPECEVAMAMEADTDPTTDNLVWSIWTGH